MLLVNRCGSQYFALNNRPEYSPPTQEQTTWAEQALELIPALEQQTESDYFDADLHMSVPEISANVS
jgi:hypothetical protein